MRAVWRSVWRGLALLTVCMVSLQLYFLCRIALMMVVDPVSTSFERSEAWRLALAPGRLAWHQHWVPYARLSSSLKRAVVTSEDARFTDHGGVEWDAVESAWSRNQRSTARADRLNERLAERLDERQTRHQTRAERAPDARAAVDKSASRAVPKLVGGSTITQQLAKNLFLDGERSLLRKAQEFVIAFMLEGLLSKQRILEIYLNNVEWGQGIFGADAAAERYFGIDASKLGPAQAARLAVMLPAPKRFEKHPASAYVVNRAATIQARMGGADLP